MFGAVRKGSLSVVAFGAVLILAVGVIPNTVSRIAPSPDSIPLSAVPTELHQATSARPSGLSPELISSAGNTVRTLLPNYNASLPGNFPSTVFDWKVGSPAVDPESLSMWLPETPISAYGAPAPIGAPAVVYNLTSNSFEGTIPALSNESALAFDSANGTVFACDPLSDSVEVYDPATSIILRSAIPVGSVPDAIAYDPANQDVFVANSLSDNVTVLSGRTYQVIFPNIGVGKSPFALAVDPTDGWVYVANANSSYLSVINATLPTAAVPSVALDLGDASGIAYSPAAGGRLLATFTGNENATLINAAKHAVIPTTVEIGLGYGPVVASSDGTTFVAGNLSGGSLTFVAATPPYHVSSTDLPVGPAPTQLVAAPNSASVLAWSGAQRYLSVVNSTSESLVENSPTLGPQPDLVLAAPNLGAVYVGDTERPSVLVLNATTGRSLSAPILLNSPPMAIANDNLTDTLFIATSGSVSEYSELSARVVLSNALLTGPNGPLLVDAAAGILWDARSGASEVEGLNLTTLEPVLSVAGVRVDSSFPESMTLDPRTSEVYAVDSLTGHVTSFLTSNGTVTAPGISAGSNLTSLAFDSADGLVYAAGAALTAINTSDHEVVGVSLPLPTHTGSAGLVFDSSKDLLYASTSSPILNYGVVSVVDGSSFSSLSGPTVSISDGLGPVDMAVFTPSHTDLNGSDFLLSANAASGTVGLIGIGPEISSFLFSPLSLDANQTATALVIASAGVGVSTISYIGLPEPCRSESVLNLSCTPTVAGVFPVEVTVTDSIGESATATAYLNVGTSIDLTATFGTLTPAEVDVGKPFHGTASATGGTPPYAFSWNFGDGTSTVGTGVTHLYSRTGSYPVVVTATDAAGGRSVESSTVHVYPVPTAAPFAGLGGTTDAGVPIELSGGVAGGAPPGVGTWSLPGGVTLPGVDVNYTWNTKGSETANFTYTDSTGVSASGYANLTVNVDPKFTGSFMWSSGASNPVPGTIISFQAALLGGSAPYSVTWSFGGGSFATGANASTSFAAAGVYHVGVTALDHAGASVTSMLTITVNTPSPSSPTIFGGNFGPGLALGLFVGVALAAVILFYVERTRRRTIPPPSPYVPPPNLSGKGKRN